MFCDLNVGNYRDIVVLCKKESLQDCRFGQEI
jgi:hypothetical protein